MEQEIRRPQASEQGDLADNARSTAPLFTCSPALALCSLCTVLILRRLSGWFPEPLDELLFFTLDTVQHILGQFLGPKENLDG